MLLYPQETIWKVQLFSIGTLQEAVRLIASNRAASYEKAMALFSELQGELRAPISRSLRRPEVRESLTRVLDLAPNHLSAKYLLLMADRQLPTKLSPRASLVEIYATTRKFHPVLSGRGGISQPVAISKDDASVIDKRLRTLSDLVHKDVVPLARAFEEFNGEFNKLCVLRRMSRKINRNQRRTYENMLKTQSARTEADRKAVLQVFDKLGTNRELMEKLLR